MDTRVIYSIDQVEVPPGLDHLTKEFAKAVMRAQPLNVYRFASEYFHRLAKNARQGSTAGIELETTQVTRQQLEALHAKLFETDKESRGVLAKADVCQVCEEVGIPGGVVDKLFWLGDFGDVQSIDWKELTVMCSTLVAESAQDVMKILFELFEEVNGYLACKDVVILFSFVSKYDQTIPRELVERLSVELVDKGGPEGKGRVNYVEFCALPMMQDHWGTVSPIVMGDKTEGEEAGREKDAGLGVIQEEGTV